MPLRGAHVGHRLDDLVLGRERSGERFGEVAHAADTARSAARRSSSATVAGTVRGRSTRGHSPSDPKQAATHAALRLGASHSTTEIIVILLASECVGGLRLSDATRSIRIITPDGPLENTPGLRQLFTRFTERATKSPRPGSSTPGCSKYGEWPGAFDLLDPRRPGTRDAASAIEAGGKISSSRSRR